MMDKLASPFPSGIYVTRGYHSTAIINGIPSNNMALDFAFDHEMYAEWNGFVDPKEVFQDNPAYMSHWYFTIAPGVKIINWHSLPVHTGTFKKGELMVYAPIHYPKQPNGDGGDHYHKLIQVNGKADSILNYVDQNSLLGGVGPYGKWSFYQNLYLNLSINPAEMITLDNNKYKVRISSTTGLRLRQAPNTQSAVLSTIPYNTIITVGVLNKGENVGRNEGWWSYNNGYLSDKFLQQA